MYHSLELYVERPCRIDVLHETIDIPGAVMSGFMRPSAHGPRDEEDAIDPNELEREEYALPTVSAFFAAPGTLIVEAP